MLQIAEDILSHISRPNYQFHDTRDVWNNNNNNNNGSAFQFQNSMERTFKRDLRSHKVSLLITSAFSLAAALIVIILVLSDARAVQQRSFSLAKRLVFENNILLSYYYTNIYRSRPSLWSCIHKAEVMPFAIAIASMAQASVFLGVQSQSLVSMWSSGCTRTAQLVWPGK